MGDKQSILFWEDTWNNRLLKQSFPRLYSFARNKNISVAKFLQNNDMQEQFHIPLSVEAFQEFQELQEIIQGIQVQENERDCWNISRVPTNTHLSNLQAPLQKHQTSFALRMWKSRCCNCWSILSPCV